MAEGGRTGEHFVDKHRYELIMRVRSVAPIVDELFQRGVLCLETYDYIGALRTSQEKMRALYTMCLRAGTDRKDLFYKILEENQPHLIADLKGEKDEKVLDKVQVQTVMAKKKLSETLNDLSSEELEEFKSLIELEKSFPLFSRRQQEVTNTQDVVELMVEKYSQECVELTKKVLKKMNRTDLLQRFSDISSGTKEKQQPSLIQRVETMASVIELLLETMKHLSEGELETFEEVLSQIRFYIHYSDFQLMWMKTTDAQDRVFLMVLTYGQKSVQTTKEVLKHMRRTDLMQRLSDSSPGPEKKQSVEEHLSALIHKVATMRAVKELLWEPFNDLSHEELKDFQWFLLFAFFQRNLPQISQRPRQEAETYGREGYVLVDVMMETCGQQSVEVTREVFMDMNRTDLVQRLSETSSGPKEKHSVNEDWPALMQKVETMTSVIELLVETLEDLSGEALEFMNYVFMPVTHSRMIETDSHSHLSNIPWLVDTTSTQDKVFLIVLTYGQQSVEKIKEVLKEMKRTDLVQRLSDSSSGPKKKRSADEQRSALIQRVATIAAVKQLLLETLNDLSKEELKEFKKLLHLIFYYNNPSDILWMRGEAIVDLMVETFGQQSVELTREVYMNMNKTDLVQKLSKPSSEHEDKHSADEHQHTLLERAAVMAAVKQILLETLNHLSHKEIEKFKRLLPFTCFQRSLPQISLRQLDRPDSVRLLVDRMVQTCGRQSVEVTEEVFRDMKRTDLLQRLSETSSRLKEKHLPKLPQKEMTMTSLQERLFETLEDLNHGELEEFKWHLQTIVGMKEGFQRIPRHKIKMASRAEIVMLMMDSHQRSTLEVIREVLEQMRRRDLVERLSDINLESKVTGSNQLMASPVTQLVKSPEPPERPLFQQPISSLQKGPTRSLKLGGVRSIKQDSSDWTKLEPEVIITDEDEAPTYSLQSETGSFECSVSGLRWASKEKASFKYQFCSWEEPMERMENLQYMPAGPLMDITVTAGKLDEVYLPHWICIDDNPEISNSFAVLHIEDCGDVVEKVSEVTPSHVKLSEPIFSPRGALIKEVLRVKIKCNMLIYYKPNTSFLKLHVYLIPQDPALQQILDEKKSSKGYERIEKSHPDKPLKLQKGFILTADIEPAKIIPKVITLRYDSQVPNFYEVFIENPDRDFHLILSHTNKDEQQGEQIWTCAIRKDDYQTSADSQAAESSAGLCHGATAREKHSVDEDLSALKQKAATITTDKERLWNILGYLEKEEFKEFKWFLEDRHVLAGLPCIPRQQLQKGSISDLVDLMFQTYTEQSVELTKKIFKKINRNDLVQML